MIARIRELDAGTTQVHGLGMRPSKADRAPLDVAAIAAWNRRQELTKDAYADAKRKADCPLPHNVGGWCPCRARRSA